MSKGRIVTFAIGMGLVVSTPTMIAHAADSALPSSPPSVSNKPATPPPGPVAGTRLTEEYVRMVAREAYFWAWPMLNIYNRRQAFKDLPEPGRMGGIVPVAPLNQLTMLTDYIEPQERLVACPN